MLDPIAEIRQVIFNLRGLLDEMEFGEARSYINYAALRLDKCVEAIEAQKPVAPAAVAPDGWKWVPIEPTDEMETAAENDYERAHSHFPDWKRAYRAMLNAAPPSPGAETKENSNG